MKRFLCILFVLLVFSLPFLSISASADVTDVLIQYAFEAFKSFCDTASDNIGSMSGDEFYDYWTQRQNFNSAGLKALISSLALRSDANGLNYVNPDLLEPFDMMADSHYNKALVNRDILQRVNDLVATGGAIDYLDYHDVGLYTTNDVIYVDCPSVGDPSRIVDFSLNSYRATYGYFRIPTLSDSAISVIHSDGQPPIVYVPSGLSLSHYGEPLPGGYAYLIVSESAIIKTALSSDTDYCFSYLFISGTDKNYMSRWSGNPYCSESSRFPGKYVFSTRSSLNNYYINGVSTTVSDSDTESQTSYYQQAAQRIGSYLKLNDYVDPYSLPADIPYDDDGNVVMLIPDGGSGSPVFISPSDYNNYINNGDIVEGDYNSTLNEQTINNIRNIYESGGDSDPSDDGTITGKLDVIIEWLRRIYNKLDFNSRQLLLDGTFGDTPVYDDFSDCVVLNIPLVSDIDNLVNSLNVVNSDSGLNEIGIYDSNGSNNVIQSSFNGFTLDLNWYAPYRQQIRDLLKIPCWILGVVCIWFNIKSIFGIHSGGAVGGE